MPATAKTPPSAPASSDNGRPRAAGRWSLEERFAEAMLVVAGRHGYADCSVEQVIQESGSSRGAFYRRYEGKLECFLQAYEVAVARFGERLAAATEGAGPWSSAVRSALVELARFVEEEPAVSRALLIEVHAAGAEAQAKRAAATRRMARALEAGFGEVKRGAKRGGQDFVAVGVVGAIEMTLQTRLERGASGEFREVVPDLVHFAVAPWVSAQTAEQEMRWARRDCAGGDEGEVSGAERGDERSAKRSGRRPARGGGRGPRRRSG